jgi:spermidine synthase
MSSDATLSASPPSSGLAIQRLLLFILLFTSGLCGISYEILYGRLLANIIGDQFIVSTAVLLTFLIGIGLGALHAHRLWRSLWLIEIGIGLYAVLFALSLAGVESFLYRFFPSIGTSTVTSLTLAVVILLLPAFLIGVSLPLFAGYAHRLRPTQGYFAATYGIYNFGAALIVIFIEFWLIRETGIRQAVFYMGALNVLVAIGLLAFFRPIMAAAPPPMALSGRGFAPRVLAALVISSMGSAVFQLTAIRLSEMLLGPFRETFAYVLCVILLGIAIGSLLVNRCRIGFVTLLIANVIALCWTLAGLGWVMELFAHYYPLVLDSYWHTVALKFACVAALTLGPAISFGATIPALLNTLDRGQDSAAKGDRAAARSPGYLLFVASFANAAGFLLMSLVLHPRLDYGELLVIVALVSGLSLVAIGMFQGSSTGVRRVATLSVLITLAALVTGARTLWNEELLYHGYLSFQSKFMMNMKLGKQSTSERYKGEQDVLSISRRVGIPYLFINGQISIRLDEATENVVGSIGGIYAADHRKAMVLGVGSGATAASVGLLFDKVDAVEISQVILENLSRMQEYNFDIVNMPNVRLVHDDAIHAVKLASRDYSLILNTVTSPLFFSSSKLYTVDFLREVKRHLTPGGLYMTWLDSRVGDKGADIMVESLTEVFPHCGLVQLSSTYLLALCSESPIVARHPLVAAEQSQLAHYFRDEFDIDPAGLAYQLIITDAAALRNPAGAPLNTLDRPVLSFEMARVAERSIDQLQKRIEQKMSLHDLGIAFRFFNWGLAPMLESVEAVSGKTVFYDVLQRDYLEIKNQQQLALSAVQDGDCEMALAFHNRAREIEGRESHSSFWLGRCLEMNKQYTQALQAYRKERELRPDSAELAMIIGRVLIWLEQYDDALQEFLLVPPDDQSVAYHYMLGQLLEKLGDSGEAQEQYAIAEQMAGSLKAAAAAALNVSGEIDATAPVIRTLH